MVIMAGPPPVDIRTPRSDLGFEQGKCHGGEPRRPSEGRDLAEAVSPRAKERGRSDAVSSSACGQRDARSSHREPRPTGPLSRLISATSSGTMARTRSVVHPCWVRLGRAPPRPSTVIPVLRVNRTLTSFQWSPTVSLATSEGVWLLTFIVLILSI